MYPVVVRLCALLSRNSFVTLFWQFCPSTSVLSVCEPPSRVQRLADSVGQPRGCRWVLLQ